jgi:hypothetical protein
MPMYVRVCMYVCVCVCVCVCVYVCGGRGDCPCSAHTTRDLCDKRNRLDPDDGTRGVAAVSQEEEVHSIMSLERAPYTQSTPIHTHTHKYTHTLLSMSLCACVCVCVCVCVCATAAGETGVWVT